jgi:hypothetical protein
MIISYFLQLSVTPINIPIIILHDFFIRNLPTDIPCFGTLLIVEYEIEGLSCAKYCYYILKLTVFKCEHCCV